MCVWGGGGRGRKDTKKLSSFSRVLTNDINGLYILIPYILNALEYYTFSVLRYYYNYAEIMFPSVRLVSNPLPPPLFPSLHIKLAFFFFFNFHRVNLRTHGLVTKAVEPSRPVVITVVLQQQMRPHK